MTGSSIMSAIHHLKIAQEFMDDFVRSHDRYARGTVKFGEYSRKIKWVLSDMATYPHFRQEVRDAIVSELKSDPFAFMSIMEKVALLNPEQRQMLEDVAEQVLAGHEMHVINKSHEKTNQDSVDQV
jgi:hypothetical protein